MYPISHKLKTASVQTSPWGFLILSSFICFLPSVYFNKRWWCEQKCKLATTPSCNNIPFKYKQINVTIQEKAAHTDYQKGILDGSLVANYLLPLNLRFLLRTTMHRCFFVYSTNMLNSNFAWCLCVLCTSAAWCSSTTRYCKSPSHKLYYDGKKNHCYCYLFNTFFM